MTLPASDPVTIQLNPRFPQPNQRVTVELDSSLIDLSKASISWSIGGKVVSRAIGQSSYEVTAGNNGTGIIVNVTITQKASVIQKSITIKPEDIEMMWDGHSYTPPFYKGKGLYPYQGEITVAALPNFIKNGSIIDPQTLVYTWKMMVM